MVGYTTHSRAVAPVVDPYRIQSGCERDRGLANVPYLRSLTSLHPGKQDVNCWQLPRRRVPSNSDRLHWWNRQSHGNTACPDGGSGARAGSRTGHRGHGARIWQRFSRFITVPQVPISLRTSATTDSYLSSRSHCIDQVVYQ